jgi:hypothetical protein
MKRLKVDRAAPSVRKFLRSLSIDANGIEIELGGKLVCKIVPPAQLSDAEKTANLAQVRDLLRRSQKRSQHASPRAIERDIRQALATVRGKR